MADEISDPRLQAEGEVSLARLALEDGYLDDAAHHVANALTWDPTLPEAHEVLGRLAVARGGGAGLFTVEAPAFIGRVVARAHMLASTGGYTEALRLLISAQAHDPGMPWADVPWVEADGLPCRIPPDELSRLFEQLIGALPDPVPPTERGPLRPFLRLARTAVRAYPHHTALLWTSSILVRRMGEPAEAEELALRSERIRPSFQAALALGYAYRSQRRWADAEAAWLRALNHDPANHYLQVDIAEVLALGGRLEEGIRWVERVLRRAPRHECGYPTACGLRYRRDGDIADLVALADFLREDPDNDHADRVLAECAGPLPWLGGVIPHPRGAVVRALDRTAGGTDLALATGLIIDEVEPPSAVLAFQRTFPAAAIVTRAVPEPDARLPSREVAHRVWSYDGTVARPAVDAPPAATARAAQHLALRTWPHPLAAYDEAVRLAGVKLTGLLGLLAHPPAPPAGHPSTWPTWVRRIQCWACLGIVHHRPDEPWASSTRRRVLYDLAYGTEDWVSEAALFALVVTAWVDPLARRDVAELVGRRFAEAAGAARTRDVTLLHSLAELVLATPGMPAEDLAAARDVLTPRLGGIRDRRRCLGRIRLRPRMRG